MARASFHLPASNSPSRTTIRTTTDEQPASPYGSVERAIRDNAAAREQLPSEQLRKASARLATITDDAYAALVERSTIEFAQGEGQPDPAAMHPLPATPQAPGSTPAAAQARPSRRGVKPPNPAQGGKK